MVSPMAIRIAVAFFLFLLSFFLERAAWYGARSVLWLHATQDLGLSAVDFSWMQTAALLLGMVTPLVGGVLALAVGRLPVLAAGAVFFLLGGGALALGGTLGLVPGLLLLALGTGFFRAPLLALVGGMFPGQSETARIGAFFLLYGAVNLAVLISSQLGAQLKAQLGLPYAWFFAGAGVLALGAGILGTAGGLLAPKEPASPPGAGRSLLGTLTVACLAMPGMLALRLAGDLSFQAPAAADLSPALFNLNPTVVLVTVAILAPVMGALHAAGVRAPSLALMAGGMALAAAGGGLLLLPGETTPFLLQLSVGVMAVGEVLVFAVGLSRAAGDHPARLSALAVGLWIVLTSLPSYLGSWVPQEGPWGRWMLLAVLLLTLAAAVGLAVCAAGARRLFEPRPRLA
jgi:dipeptide/tripeptide permease